MSNDKKMDRSGILARAVSLIKWLHASFFLPLLNVHFIIDCKKKLGNFGLKEITYDTSIIKEEIARKFIFDIPGMSLNFMDVGGGVGKLEYLLGIKENFHFEKAFYEHNLFLFKKKYNYYSLEVDSRKFLPTVIGDICSDSFLVDHPEYVGFFDVVYSNNVFEHLKKPWVATGNLVSMLKPNGLCVTITPFSIRYHESPVDYFRYTHEGLAHLFELTGKAQILVKGYDIVGRRNNWQGSGTNNDICPVDTFGAWRENWFTVVIVRKVG